MLSWESWRRGLGASSRSSSATRSSTPSTVRWRDVGDVEQRRRGRQRRVAGRGVGVGHAGLLSGGVVGVRRRRVAACRAATVSAAIWSSAWAGSVMTWMRSHSTAERLDPDAQVDRRDVVVGEPADPLRRRPACPTSRRLRARRRSGGGAGWSSPAGRRRARSRRRRTRSRRRSGSPGTSAHRLGAVGQQLDAVAEQRGGAAPVDLAQRVGEDPADRPERVLVGAHRAGGVDDQRRRAAARSARSPGG